MFCPNCGSDGQSVDSFCRICGNFLPEFDAVGKRRITPRQHLTANTVLSAMTAVVSAALAILLYATFLGKDDTPILIYVTAGFLTAMFFWQVQAIWRSVLLRKSLPERSPAGKAPGRTPEVKAAATNRLLDQAEPEAFIPPSVTDETTRRLAEKLPRRSTKTEH